jgi:tight adherence protein B
MRILAVLLAASSAVLLVSPPRPAPRAGSRLRGSRRPQAGRVPTLVLFGTTAAVLLTLDGTRLLLCLVALGGAGAAAVLVRRGRVAKAADRRRALVVSVCEALVGELRAGRPLTASLAQCLEVWPAFEPVVAAGRLGADVPGALRRLAELPGAEGLREIASAWQVSHSSGAGLASALAQVAATARERQGTRRLVQGELASAQATARLVTVLPVATLAMSAGIGADPWHFLLATPVGVVCLGLGGLFAFAGLLWIDRIASSVLRG